MRNSIIFYRSFYDAIKELDPKIQAVVYNAIFEYSLNFNEVALNGLPKTIFTLIKPQLDANNKRFDNGKKGGKKPNQDVTEPEPKPNQNITKTEANNNVNVNDNDNDIIINDCVKIPLKENVFPNMPHLDDLGAAPKTTVKSAVEMLKITCQVDLEEPEVHTMWNIFKNQNLTGKRYYPDKEAVYSHFINWIIKKDFKKQRNGATKKHTSVGETMCFDQL